MKCTWHPLFVFFHVMRKLYGMTLKGCMVREGCVPHKNEPYFLGFETGFVSLTFRVSGLDSGLASVFVGSTFLGSVFLDSTFFGSPFVGSTFFGSVFLDSTSLGSPFVGSVFLDSTFFGSGFFDSFFFVSAIGLSTPILKNILRFLPGMTDRENASPSEGARVQGK